jgi:carboxylesterase type B
MQERPRQFMRVVQDFVRTIRQDERVLVNTKNGHLRGRYQPYKTGTPGGYYSFQGIRYGKAPMGNRRFRAALPEEPWKGIRPAMREGTSCPHRNMVLERYRGSEDCLFLNVYTPQLYARNKKLPVLFWIHGGAFTFGNGNSFLLGPDYFMQSNDIILVTINYRLGTLGFLNTGTHDAPGNAGLKDQVLALKWVRDNIEFFGGDPKEVTVGGQSAGAASVHYLMLSPLGKGLFKRAIAQSGVTLNPWSVTDVTAERAFKLGNVLNYATNDTESLVSKLN